MGLRPALNAVCGRCGKPRGLTHDCVSNSRRKQTIRLRLSFGKCPTCGKSYGSNPLTHVCTKKTDFRKRKAEFDKQQREKERQKAKAARPKHDYTECSDTDCKRSLCVAYKAGIALGDAEGFQRGWRQGYSQGLAEGKKQ